MINKDDLSNQLKQIEVAIQQLTANYNLMEGRKQECLHWIKIMEDKENASLNQESETQGELPCQNSTDNPAQ